MKKINESMEFNKEFTKDDFAKSLQYVKENSLIMTVAGHEIHVQKIDNNFCKHEFDKDYSVFVKEILEEFNESSAIAIKELFKICEEEYDETLIENVVDLSVNYVLQYLLEAREGKRRKESSYRKMITTMHNEEKDF